jgi:hypothetical protein
VLFGGRIAEELFMKQMTTGASNDFQRATDLARRMVTQWGMSDSMGPMVYGEEEGEIFLGRSVTTHKNVSESTMQKVDQENPPHPRRAICPGASPAGRESRQGRGHDGRAAGTGNHRRRPDQRHHGRPATTSAEDFEFAPTSRGDNAPGPEPTAPAPCLTTDINSDRRPPMQRFGGLFFHEPELSLRPLRSECGRPLIMGIVNLSDDSFSGDGLHGDAAAAIAQAHRLIAEVRTSSTSAPSLRAPAPIRLRLATKRSACCRWWRPCVSVVCRCLSIP